MLATKLRTWRRLGLRNLGRVAIYRTALRLGLHPVQRLRRRPAMPPYFSAAAVPDAALADRPPERLFGHLPVGSLEIPVAWTRNPLNDAGPDLALPWWEIPDFDSTVGDIKTIWELSRLGWVIGMAQRNELAGLDALLADWSRANPPFRGPNWKCGQEASLRVLHLVAASLILGTDGSSLPGLLDLIELHCARILPTVAYAAAQDNNHGTSEAAALFVGGHLLIRNGRETGQTCAAEGRRSLEERISRLVLKDGTFSQYSTNYHRLMLDTVGFAEAFRRRIGAGVFSANFCERMASAARWLADMVDPDSGDVPVLGANDGAHVLNFGHHAYREYRPSAGLALALFVPGDLRFANAASRALESLGVTAGGGQRIPEAPQVVAAMLNDGGFLHGRVEKAFVLFRFARFAFRPSQADLNHIDLWVTGENFLRDGGTYGYNQGDRWIGYFGGIASHNSIQFDGLEPMPRLGRFLLGDWPDSEVAEADYEHGDVLLTSAYRSAAGARHSRTIRLAANSLEVRDEIEGFDHEALLRWRLVPANWETIGTGCFTSAKMRIAITDRDGQPIESQLGVGYESRHYLELTELPVIETRLTKPGAVISRFEWD